MKKSPQCLLSLKPLYAMEVMVYFACLPGEYNFVVKSLMVAHKTDVPYTWLVRIISDLSKAGLLVSIRGPGGGHYLNRHPREISLMDIIYAVGKDIIVIHPSRVLFPSKDMTLFFSQLHSKIYSDFENTTLLDICDRDKVSPRWK